jgi:hypothetical protein
MNKRVEKRHMRQVSRAKNRVRLSEPDVRTPEQIKAARQASRPASGWGIGPQASYSRPSTRNNANSAAHSPATVDG